MILDREDRLNIEKGLLILNSEDLKIAKNNLKEDLSIKYYHGSENAEIKHFLTPITWITTDFEYAKSYAVAQKDVGYVYTCSIPNSLNFIDVGRTGVSLYSMMPTKKDFSPQFKKVLVYLNLSDEEAYKLIDDVADEWGYIKDSREKYQGIKLSTIVRSDEFKNLAANKGYDGVKAIEYNAASGRYCDTYGIFDASKITIINVEKVEYKEIKIEGESNNMSKTKIVNSDLNNDYFKMLTENVDDNTENFEDEDNINIAKVLEKECYIKDIDGNKISSWCFAKPVADEYGMTEEELANYAYEHGFKVFKVFAGETYEGGYVIANKDCPANEIISAYSNFFGVEPDIEEQTYETNSKNEELSEKKLLKEYTTYHFGEPEYPLDYDCGEYDPHTGKFENEEIDEDEIEFIERTRGSLTTDFKGNKITTPTWCVSCRGNVAEFNDKNEAREYYKQIIGKYPMVIKVDDYYKPPGYDDYIRNRAKKLKEDNNSLDINESIETHDELNPKLFKDNKLISEVRDAILKITDEFLNGLKEDEIVLTPKDIIILGSNCSYNYNVTSDLDIHIIADNAENCKYLDKLYSAYRSIFNKNLDITIKDIPAELYVELDECNAKSNGIYSVLNDKWIKKPVHEDIPEIDEDKLENLSNLWGERYCEILKNPTYEDIEKFINDIYDLRKSSIDSEGEYGMGNLVFKEVRGLGILDELKNLKNELKSKELSLENLNENTDDYDESEDFWNLRNREVGLKYIKYNGSNVYLTADNKIAPVPPELCANKFSVSCEQSSKGIYKSKEEMYKFKDEVKGDVIVFFFDLLNKWGGEYSVITSNELLARKACFKYAQDGYAHFDAEGNYAGAYNARGIEIDPDFITEPEKIAKVA